MWQWLLRPVTTFRQGVSLFATALVCCLGWSMMMSTTLRPMRVAVAPFDITSFGWAVIPLIAVSVLVEEAIRLAPLALAAWLSRRNAAVVLGTAAVTAALFGAAHVMNGLPLWFVLMCQGVTGYVMNLLYLKVGGLHGRKALGFLYAYAFHLCFDLVIIVPALLLRHR